MKRLLCILLIALALTACSRKEPTPTASPAPTLPPSPTFTPRSTATPAGSPVPRITIIPSATRLSSQSASSTGEAEPSPTGTGTSAPSPTLAPSSTPTPRIIDAGATETPLPTPTLADSPLPTPTPSEVSPSASVPTNTATAMPSTTAPSVSATPTPADESGETAPTSTATQTSTPPEGSWGFENVYTFYDDGSQEFYVWGEIVNNTGSPQRITSFWPVVYDEEGELVTSKDEVNAIGSGYKELREGVDLPAGRNLPFSFLVSLPEGTVVRENYDFMVEAEPASAPRADLDIAREDYDASDWPQSLFVDGSYEIPDPDLAEYVAIVVTLYGEGERVIGMGWVYSTDASDLSAGEHGFELEIEQWDVVAELEFDLETYKVQIFGN